jgi:allantoate deiminase
MIEEEGARFSASLYGSRAMTGKIDVAQLKQRKDSTGISMYDALRDFGFNPDEIDQARRPDGSVKAFLELHIEQGPVLETENLDIGIVRSIVGINELSILVKGRQGHAGTIPMHLRADAMDIAAKVIAQIADIARAVGGGTVATVGSISVKPGGYNIIPGEVEFSVDIRSANAEQIDSVEQRIRELVDVVTHGSEVKCEISNLMKIAPVQMAMHIVEQETVIAQNLGLHSRMMSSGAGHDAMIMAAVTNAGLLFVPSLAGRSHCPEEWTDYEQLQKGIEVYLHTVLGLAEVVN